MHISNAQTIYFAGIGGIGMSALAQLLLYDGVKISGSDISRSEIIESLKRKGIHIEFEQDGKSVQGDLFIYSDALPENHPERVAARNANITELSYFEALGQYMEEFEYVIAISGTHGKSTTTAMVAAFLVNAGLDPTVIVGSIVKEFGSNARIGSKELMVVEACEHKAHMLNLHPNMIVLTNIEEDHLDYYRDLDHIVMTFQKYIDLLPIDGVLIKNLDDSESRDIGTDSKILTYAIEEQADFQATKIAQTKKGQSFTVNKKEYVLSKPGIFNVYNALAAIAVAKYLKVSEKIIVKTLKSFKGIWRRFEILGTYKGATVVSDYAHHPTAVHYTIKAAHTFFEGRRIVVVFQPHQHSRTIKFFDRFVESVSEADFSIIQEVYDVVGRNEGKKVTSKELVQGVERKGKYSIFTEDVAATRNEIDKIIEKDDVLLIMGAGDIYKLAEELTQ